MMMSSSGKEKSARFGMGTGMQEPCPLAHANPPRLQLVGMLLTGQYGYAYCTPGLCSCKTRPFFFLPFSGSLLSGCLFGRKQTAEGRCLKEKKKVNLSGKSPSEKMKSRRAQDKETCSGSLECVSSRLMGTDRKENSPAIDHGNICLCRLLAFQYCVLI